MADAKQPAAIEAVQVGTWKTGFHHGTKQAFLVFEFADRPPLPFLIPLDQATAIGRALIDLDSAGVSSPARPN